MKLSKQVTDFIVLEEGNIGRKSVVVTGAALASSVLGGVLAQTALAGDHCDCPHCDNVIHTDWLSHVDNSHSQDILHMDNICD